MVFDVSKISANPSNQALGGKIDLQVLFRNHGSRAIITDVRALIRMMRPDGTPIDIGVAQSFDNNAEISTSPPNDFPYRFTWLLDSWTVKAIEELRGNNRLRLDFQFVILGLKSGSGNPPATEGLRWETGGRLEIAKSDWVEAYLPALGYGNWEAWELRFQSIPVPDHLKKEADGLRNAVKLYDHGDYEGVYRDCRNFVEGLIKREADLGLSVLVGPEEWKRMKSYLSIALHSEQEIPRKIVRADAEFAISIVLALYRRVAHALSSPK